MRARPQAQKGFSIIELMVVVTILGIIAAIAAPNMGIMIRTQRVRSNAFDVFSSLTLARSEAVKRNVAVTMTPTGGDWAQGWTVADANGNVLRQQGKIDSVTVTGPASVTYNGTGRLAAAVVNFVLTAPDVDATTGYRCIGIDLSGRPASKVGGGPC